MESDGIPFVGPRKTYVFFNHPRTPWIDVFQLFIAGSGKSTLLCVMPLRLWLKSFIFPSSSAIIEDIKGTRSRNGHDGLLLFRFSRCQQTESLRPPHFSPLSTICPIGLISRHPCQVIFR